MSICFICASADNKIGSHRIWVNDLCHYFKEMGIKCKINIPNPQDYDIHIYSKNTFGKLKYPDKINGCINPPADKKHELRKYDFIIVGSIEEKDSMMKSVSNVFIYPLIEKMYMDVTPKVHTPKEQIVIGYHGNPNHLNHFHLGLKQALEKLKTKFNILLRFTCANKHEWLLGKPDIPMEFVKWNLKEITKTIQSFDIGVVTNISEFEQNKGLVTQLEKGLYNTDYIIRFKNKSNNGRILVLAQCGIPIVADITPSNLHLLGDPDNGFACLSKEGWYDALYKLCEDHELRNFVSQNAYREFHRLYEPRKWAEKLYKNILNIKK